MSVSIIPCRADNYCYIVELSEGKALLVDASEAGPILEELENRSLTLEAILLTHEHSDHVDGLTDIKSSFPDAKIFGHQKGKFADNYIDEVKSIELAGTEIQILNTPGHSEICMSYYLPKQRAVFTGDCLFVAGCGRVFTKNYDSMFKSFSALKALPSDTLVYCGHDYLLGNLKFCLSLEPENQSLKEAIEEANEMLEAGAPSVPGSIEQELQCNPFFAAKSVEEFKKFRGKKDSF